MIVIFDIDDVLMPWAEKVHEACVLAGLTDGKEKWKSWAMWESYGCTKEEWLAVVNGLVVPEGIYHAAPYPGAAEAVRKLVDLGHEVHLVTARGFFDHAAEIRDWTIEWIETFKIPGTLWFAQDKGNVALDVDADYAIDDRDKNCREMRDAGVDTFMMNQPHNLLEYWPSWRRVESVAEFVDKILHLEEEG